LGDPAKDDYQDNNHLKIIKNSKIPKILEKYGFDYRDIVDAESFFLLEKPAPSMCADRFDYAVRELACLGKNDLVKLCVNGLINVNGQMVFKNKKSAESFANAYLKLQKEHWSESNAKARYYILAQILKKALGLKLISEGDLMNTDQFIIDILENSKDKEIREQLDMLKNGFRIKESKDGIELKKKFRYVNPEVLANGGVVKLTEISEKYRNAVEKEKANKDVIVRVKIYNKKIIN
jgi:HD superfamily phosphohydrolase